MPEPSHPDWPEATATVTSCHYNAGAGRAMAFGLPSGHFQITYNYWAAGELHTGEFASDKAIPQNTLFPIRYNPEAPHRNTHTASRRIIAKSPPRHRSYRIDPPLARMAPAPPRMSLIPPYPSPS